VTMTEPQPTGARTEIPKVISVDDHIVEPPHLWQTWLPEKFKERGPRVERRRVGDITFVGGAKMYEYELDAPDAPWGDVWFYEDLIHPNKRHVAAVGFPRDQMEAVPITYDEMRDGCYDPKARIADNSMNHVEVSLSFPTFPRFCGQTFYEAKDKELALACVKAYNDFQVEEWCGDSNGALVPLAIIPLWDVELAVEEINRNAARGVHAVCFSEIPPNLGLPSIHTKYWDPFFAVCADTKTTVCMHIGSSSKMPAASPDSPVAVTASLSFNNAIASMADFLFSGVLVRFPELKLAYSEGQIGWIPYILERCDDVWENHRAWAGVNEAIPEPPSSYYYSNIYGCFFRDNHGLRSLEEVGVDNITFETDYPHTDSSWPHTKEIAEKMMGHLPLDVVWKIVRGNAARMLSIDIEPCPTV
jgi:predicted TIM-barrel fold metal-dependent hydrolase